jgi:hypothetical protein
MTTEVTEGTKEVTKGQPGNNGEKAEQDRTYRCQHNVVPSPLVSGRYSLPFKGRAGVGMGFFGTGKITTELHPSLYLIR